MAEYTRNTGNTGGTESTSGAGGTGYSGGTDNTGGTGYTGGDEHRGPNDRRDRESKSSAAVWIVGIVVVVGALAIWIARNTVDEADSMRSRPGMEQTAPDRDLDGTGSADPYGTEGTQDLPLENRAGDQGSFGTEVPSDGQQLNDQGALDAQEGTGTISENSEDPRLQEGNSPNGYTSGTQSGGTATTGAPGTHGAATTTSTGTGTAGEGVGTGTTGTSTNSERSNTGTGTGTTGAGSGSGVGTGTGTQSTGTQNSGTGTTP